MSNSITIITNDIKLLVNDDPSRVISFNPEDLTFIDELYKTISEFETKSKEFRAKDAALAANKNVDKTGVPKNFSKRLALTKEACKYWRAKIDLLFGEGTSEAAFGKANTLDMFSQFFDGITPYIKNVRAKKTQKYLNDDSDSDVMT